MSNLRINDGHELLCRWLIDGFTLESISKATNISYELLERFYKKGDMSHEEIMSLEYLLVFLAQLYLVDVDSEDYVKSMACSMNMFFQIDNLAIANYLNLSENEFIVFINNPDKHINSYYLTKKLIHLFTNLTRDKRHSI